MIGQEVSNLERKVSIPHQDMILVENQNSSIAWLKHLHSPVILKRWDNKANKLKMYRILWSSAKIFWTKNYWELLVARGFIASYFLMLEEGSLSSSNSFGSYGSAKSRWAA